VWIPAGSVPAASVGPSKVHVWLEPGELPLPAARRSFNLGGLGATVPTIGRRVSGRLHHTFSMRQADDEDLGEPSIPSGTTLFGVTDLPWMRLFQMLHEGNLSLLDESPSLTKHSGDWNGTATAAHDPACDCSVAGDTTLVEDWITYMDSAPIRPFRRKIGTAFDQDIMPDGVNWEPFAFPTCIPSLISWDSATNYTYTWIQSYTGDGSDAEPHYESSSKQGWVAQRGPAAVQLPDHRRT